MRSHNACKRAFTVSASGSAGRRGAGPLRRSRGIRRERVSVLPTAEAWAHVERASIRAAYSLGKWAGLIGRQSEAGMMSSRRRYHATRASASIEPGNRNDDGRAAIVSAAYTSSAAVGLRGRFRPAVDISTTSGVGGGVREEELRGGALGPPTRGVGPDRRRGTDRGAAAGVDFRLLLSFCAARVAEAVAVGSESFARRLPLS